MTMISKWRHLQKFGLQYCDFKTMLSNVSSLLRTLTLTIDSRDEKRIPTFVYVLNVILAVSYIYCYVGSAIWFVFWRCYKTGDLTNGAIVFSLSITSSVVIMKLLYMLFLTEKLKHITNRYLLCDSQIIAGSRFSENMKKLLRKVKRRGIIYWSVLIIDGTAYVLRPIVTPGRHLTMDGIVFYGLEPMLESPNFEIASILSATAVIYICYAVANLAVYLVLILGYTQAHMLALSDEMINIWKDANEHCQKIIKQAYKFESIWHTNIDEVFTYRFTEQIINSYIRDQLIDIKEKHATNKDILKEIEDTMKGQNIVGFTFLIVGLITELLGGLENTFLQLPFTLVQLGVDCYLGQQIMDANIVFEKAVYDCQWENFDESNKKIVLMMLQNSQRTMTLSAGGMATLNFATFMSIIRSTYSAYTSLRSMIR